MSSPSGNPFRNLIREIHRRSLWQVLGIYLAGSWVAYEVAQGLTEGLGLPAWLPGVALVLLIIGLPVVLATAFVQEGGPEVSSTDSVADLESILFGDGTPGTEPSTLHRLFSWRNALLGGAAAFVLLTTVAISWMNVARTDLAASLGVVFDEVGSEPSIDPSVAVMPCDDLSPTGDQAALAQGIADEVSMALSQLPDLKVSGRSSVLAMEAQEADLATISSTLGVGNVLQCTLVRDGSAVRVNAALTEAETGSVHTLTWALEAAGRIEGAIEHSREMLELAPDWPTGWNGHALRLLRNGYHDEGLEAGLEWARIAGLDVEAATAAFEAVIRYAETGDPPTISVPTDWPSESMSMWWNVHVGRSERALDLIETEIDSGRVGVIGLRHAIGVFEPLVDHPRYQALLEEAGITW